MSNNNDNRWFPHKTGNGKTNRKNRRNEINNMIY